MSLLINAFYKLEPVADNPAQVVAFGTSGHRGSSLAASFNERHILAIAQAVVDYRQHANITGPLFIGFGVCQASCPISYAANTTFLSNSLLSFDGFSQTSLTGFQLRTERFFQRSGLASLAVS